MNASELMAATSNAKRDYEREWLDWLLAHPIWEQHFIFKHELAWHDDFVSGEIDLVTLDKLIRAEFAHLVAS